MRKFIPKENHIRQYGEWAITHWWNVGRYSILPKFVTEEAEKFKKNKKQKLHLLDIGAGGGEMMKRLSDNFKVFGVDISQKAIQAARQNNITLQQGDAKRLPCEKESFDIITAFDLLEHFTDDVKILHHWRSRLKTKGLLFLAVPAFQWLWSVDDIIAGHKRRYSRQELEGKLIASGFQVRRMTYFNFFLFPIAAFIKVWKRLHVDFNKISDEELFSHFGFHIGYNKLANTLLTKIFSSEEYLIRHWSLPFGVSLLVCAQKT